MKQYRTTFDEIVMETINFSLYHSDQTAAWFNVNDDVVRFKLIEDSIFGKNKVYVQN